MLRSSDPNTARALALADAALAIAAEKREARLRRDAAAARGQRAMLVHEVQVEHELRARGLVPVEATRQMRQAFGPDSQVWVGPNGAMHVQREGIRRAAFGHQLHKVK